MLNLTTTQLQRQFFALSLTTMSLCHFSKQSDKKFFVMFGAPGVGKGTYAKFMKKEFKLNHISTGDEIRKILKGKAGANFDKNLIKEIKDIVNSGKLVSDEIVLNIIKEKLKEPESKNGVILDGFPRTVSQLEKYDKLGFPTHLVINIWLNFDILLQKLMGRRVCNTCGENYNIYSINKDGYDMEPLLPKTEGICDKDGGKLIIRSDDNEDVISKRMKEYEEKTIPLLNVYKQRGLVLDFEAKRGVKDYPRLSGLIKERLNQK